MNALVPNLNELKVDTKFIGVPYLADGNILSGTDCAGLACLFLQENDINLPKGVSQDSIKEFILKGKIVKNKNELCPLDILIFKYNDIFHVGIYIGYGKFLQQNVNTTSGIVRFNSFWGNHFYYAVRPTELYYNNQELYDEVKDKRIEFVASAIATAVASFVAGAVGAITIGAGVSSLFAFNVAYAITSFALYVGLSYGVSALMAATQKAPKPNFGAGGIAEGSPRYGFGSLQNTATSDLPVPILYGELKLAGNAIYQSDPAEIVYRCDVLCEGEVNSITDVRVNDIPVGDLTGCSITTYTGTSSQNVDSRFSDRVYGLRNMSYLALTLQTSDKLKGGFPAITCVVQGLKVETWDGLKWVITKTYSNNPAACVRDFIINTRYGIGMSKSLLDDSSFGEAFDYCNIMVSDNASSTEKRYTIDYIIDSKKPAVDILNELIALCGGFLVWSGNRLKLRIEKVENVVQNFTMSNIVEGSFSYQYVPKDTMVNRVRLLYIDPTQNYTKVYALAEDKVSQDELANIEGGNGIIEKEIALLGVTKFSRASRLANMFLKNVKATPMTCKFKVGIYAVHCEPGDVITISHDVPSWVNKPFRIFSIEEEENDEISLICKEYNDSVYDDSYGSGITTYQYGSPPNYLKNTAEISSLITSEVGWRNEDGTHIASVDLSWIAPNVSDYLTGYYIEWSKDGASYIFASRAEFGATSARIPNAVVGSSYIIRIKTVNYYGIKSNGVISGSVSMMGKDAEPPDVQNFIVNQYRDSLVFTWDKITSIPDIHHYEIKQGVTWSVGTPVATLLKNNSFTYGNIKNGTQTYWIKAVDNSGNYSVNAVSSSVTVISIPFQNIIATRNEHTVWSGNKNNLHISGDNLEINTGYLSGDYIAPWWDVGKLVTARMGFSYAVTTSGDLRWDNDATSAFDTYDNLRFSGFDVPQNLSFFVQTSGDSGASGDWTAWQFSDYYFRYLRTKAVMGRDGVNQTTILQSLTQSADVPDVDEFGPTDGSYRYCATTGDNVTFNKTFYYAPEVSISVYPSGNITRTPEVASTTSGFSLTLRDKTDTAVPGNYRFHAHGF